MNAKNISHNDNGNHQNDFVVIFEAVRRPIKVFQIESFGF